MATWNVGSLNSCERVALADDDSLNLDRVTLLCAQEVSESRFSDLLEYGAFDWGVLSLHHNLRLSGVSDSERLGVAVFGRDPCRLRSSETLDALPYPEKFIAVSVDLGFEGFTPPVTVASYHARPGPGKGRSTLAVAHYFELNLGPSILGLDANSPDVDHPDHEQSVYHWRHAPFAHCEPALIGAPKYRRHRMEDAFRRFLTKDDIERIRAERPEGPLAVTYDRDKSSSTVTGSRYDSVWVTPEFEVVTVDHLWSVDPDAGTEAPIGGSDHAMVAADLAPRSVTRARNSGEDVIDHVIRSMLVEAGEPVRFNVEHLPEVARATVRNRSNASFTSATFNADRTRPLRWAQDGNNYGLLELARQIASEAGVDLPSRPAGPNWWIVEKSGRTLVELSGDAHYM